MAILRVLGDWLEDSGWVAVIVKSGIATQGTAESFLKASHVSKTRHAHQVSAAALYLLLRRAYDRYCQEHRDHDDELLQFEDWSEKIELEKPQFKYWSLALHLQMSLLVLVRSFREGNLRCIAEYSSA